MSIAPAAPRVGGNLASDTQIIDVHSLHKSGTMFLFKFFQHLAGKQDITFVSENHSPADDYSVLPATELNERSVICRCPIRTLEMDPFRVPGIKQRRIFHIRDPRDMLVSEYFSFGWIHPVDSPLSGRRSEIQQMTVDEYVVQQSEHSALPLEDRFDPLIGYQFDPEFETVVKYEQMVTDFPRWCQQVVKACGLRFPKITALRLVWRYRNEFKTTGESMQHKRRITPGDFREKLKPETIAVLNKRFDAILKQFDYLD